MFQSSSADGVWLASASMYMLSMPGTSTSHAEGISSFDIMLMIVHGTTPKNSSIDVQHCSAVMLHVRLLHPRFHHRPSLAIFISASSEMPAVET